MLFDKNHDRTPSGGNSKWYRGQFQLCVVYREGERCQHYEVVSNGELTATDQCLQGAMTHLIAADQLMRRFSSRLSNRFERRTVLKFNWVGSKWSK